MRVSLERLARIIGIFLTGGNYRNYKKSTANERQAAREVDQYLMVRLAILQATMRAPVLTVVTIAIANLIHAPADWPQVFLFFACGFYVLWRKSQSRNRRQTSNRTLVTA
jgi:hypothetical protein